MPMCIPELVPHPAAAKPEGAGGFLEGLVTVCRVVIRPTGDRLDGTAPDPTAGACATALLTALLGRPGCGMVAFLVPFDATLAGSPRR